jgi:flavorubredoxin
VLYTSDYGYSDRLSQTLAKGITKAGVKTEMVDVLSVDPQVRMDILPVTRSYNMQPSTCLQALRALTMWCLHLLS